MVRVWSETPSRIRHHADHDRDCNSQSERGTAYYLAAMVDHGHYGWYVKGERIHSTVRNFLIWVCGLFPDGAGVNKFAQETVPSPVNVQGKVGVISTAFQRSLISTYT